MSKLFSKLTDLKSIIAAASLAAVIGIASAGAVFADGANHYTHDQKKDKWRNDIH